MRTTIPVDGFAGGLAATLGPAIKALSQNKGSSLMAGAQGALMGAQTAAATEEARDLRMTNDSRANPFALLEDPQIAEYAKSNPTYANALRVGLGLFGATGEGDIAGMLSKIQGSDLTGQGVARGNAGDVANQNRLVAAANGNTYEPFKAVGNTGFAIDSGTGEINAGNVGLSNLFIDKERSGMSEAEGQPFEVSQNGVPVLVQRYKDGSIRPVNDFQPKLRDDFAITTNPDGTVSVTKGTKPPKITEQQSKDLVYLERGEAALANLDQIDDVLANAVERASGSIPLAGNALVSENFQKAQQAGREFLAAVLRKDTGAAITQQEMEIYGETYLPQPFDTPAVLEQKARARRTALDAIRKGLSSVADMATPRPGGPLPSPNGGVQQATPPQSTLAPKGQGRPFEYEGRRGVMYQDGSYEWVN
ncbi:MAG: hypothetical protein CML16_17490 [Pusillimonas sp.]|nr:hypothetical protein [Pusillimonas sp.]|tara:strand:+ start:7638 stop:8900 length:1263 start_codon:yes stop_codon:yes gene_type:complete